MSVADAFHWQPSIENCDLHARRSFRLYPITIKTRMATSAVAKIFGRRRGTPPGAKAVLDPRQTGAWDCYTAARVVVIPARWRPYGERIGRQGCRRDRGCIGHRIGQCRGDVGRRRARGDGRPRRGGAEDALQQARRGGDPAGHRPARSQGLRHALLPGVLEKAGQLDILHANAGTYVGGDLVDADTGAIDRMLNLNVNVVMKNVHDVLPHMIERRTGDIIVTSSLAAHFPTPWEPVYASSKWAINCFVQ